GHPVMLPSLRESQNDTYQMLTSLGELYVRGVEVDWVALDQAYPRRKLLLPTYPFQRARYWSDAPQPGRGSALRPRGASLRALIDKMTSSPLLAETIFETEFSVAALPWLREHRVYSTVISPGACQIAMLLQAAALTFGDAGCQLADLVLPTALVLPEGEARTVQLLWTPEALNGHGAGAALKLISFAQGQTAVPVQTDESQLHATARVYQQIHGMAEVGQRTLAQLQHAHTAVLDLSTLYTAENQPALVLGPTFQWLDRAWRGDDASVLVQLRLPESVSSTAGYALHPGLLDACFQSASLTNGPAQADELCLPFAVDSLRLFPAAHHVTGRNEWWCHARSTGQHTWDIQLLDGAGVLLVDMTGFTVRAAPPEALGAELWRDWLYKVQWQPQPLTDTSSLPSLDGQPWLIFAHQTGVAEALEAELQRHGAQPILVYPGAQYRQVEPQRYVINPACKAEYTQLLQTVPTLQGIFYLWPVASSA
ncbi:MAG: polyketide synthase dehydratase domain-containing protein, partial [Caldilineaceae bacterium]|nr:polyketide synthase dehydratase domain-containing protein [Caldilineaceae bacterium]